MGSQKDFQIKTRLETQTAIQKQTETNSATRWEIHSVTAKHLETKMGLQTDSPTGTQKEIGLGFLKATQITIDLETLKRSD